MATAPVDPEALCAFLSDGAAFGLPGAEVERITTHAAEIFLVADRAFKMKRAVKYSFLDFTSRERRQQALEAELRLNRRTAPMLYRRLVPVTRDNDGTLAVDGPGETIEWLLEMARFDQDALLNQIAQEGALQPTTIDALAGAIAAFHRDAERRSDMGGAAAMRAVVDGNAEDLTALAGSVLEPERVRTLLAATCTALERGADLLEQRRIDGFVRHCHGDLHLGNIVLIDGAPTLFDALEFDEALATTDTFYDLAFLLMDLIHRDLGGLAQRLLNGYLDATWDDGGTALLPVFLSIRAAIRAKVTGFAAAAQPTEALRADEIAAARSYLDLAQRFLAPAPPRVIAIGGLSGTGKSTLGRALAPQLGAAPGAILLRSDVIRKTLLGVAHTDRLDKKAYSEEVSLRVYETLVSRMKKLVQCGHAAIIDAVFLDPGHRGLIEQAATELAVPFEGIWLQAPAATLMERVESRRGDASDATSAVVQSQLRVDPGPMAWRRLDAAKGEGSVAEMARSLLAEGSAG